MRPLKDSKTGTRFQLQGIQGPPSFLPILKNKHPEKLYCTFFFTRNVCTVTFSERGLKALSRSQNDKTFDI